MDLVEFSKNRLGGEPIPDDLRILLDHAEELNDRLGFELNGEGDWAPWLDTSYLRPEELANPDIAANIRAIAEVCQFIAFVGAHEDGQYLGYWRGPTNRAIADAPLVFLDNEGQFELVPGPTLAEAILQVLAFGDRSDEVRNWMRSIGIDIVESPEDLPEADNPDSPDRMHAELNERYRTGA